MLEARSRHYTRSTCRCVYGWRYCVNERGGMLRRHDIVVVERGRMHCTFFAAEITRRSRSLPQHLANKNPSKMYLDRRSSRSSTHCSTRAICTRTCPAGTLRRRTCPHSTPCKKMRLMSCCSSRSSEDQCTGRFRGSGCEPREDHRGTCRQR